MPDPEQVLALVPITYDAAAGLLAGTPALPCAPGYPHADTYDALRMFVAGGDRDAVNGWFVVLDGLVVGDCGTKPGTPETEIGYGLAAPYRGRGLGTAAVRLLLDLLPPGPVVAETHVSNTASRRLLERLGFAVDRVDGESVWYRLVTGR